MPMKNLSVVHKSYQNIGNAAVLENVDANALSVLDVGCGAGDNARILQAQGRTIDGITLSDSEYETSKKYCQNVYIHNIEQGLPPAILQNQYDVVICSHVLEHICFPDAVLQDIKKVLKPNGRFIVALPNLMHYSTRIPLIFGNFNYQEMGIMDNTHFKWYTFLSAKQILFRHGFVIEKADVEIVLPFGRVSNRFPVFLKNTIKNVLRVLSKGLFGWQLLYVAKP